MALFLYKPHVEGQQGNVTSPDIVVDRVLLDGALVPVGRLTHESWQQIASGEDARAAYALMALGGGALILPAVVLGSGAIIVARKAWRLQNLLDHIGEVTLNGVALSRLGPPSAMIEAAGGSGDVLPRGCLSVRTAAGGANGAELADPRLGRSLAHRVVLQPVDEDRWGDARPAPRYATGPMKRDVPHYI